MNDSARYAKVVEWSEEDGCYVGSALGLIYDACHGDDERAVFEQLCALVDQVIATYKREDRALPPPTAEGRLSYHGIRPFSWRGGKVVTPG